MDNDDRLPEFLKRLRFYPVFVLLGLGLAPCLFVSFTRLITHGFMDQVVVPRLHGLELKPGDSIHVGTSGAYRPCVIHHADGTTTDTGELSFGIQLVRLLPSTLPAGILWFGLIYVLARLWPKHDPPPAAASPE